MLVLKLFDAKRKWLYILWLLFVGVSLFLVLYPLFLFDGYAGKRELQIIITLVSQLLLLSTSIFNHYINTILNLSRLVKLSLVIVFLSGLQSSFFAEYQLYAWGDFLHYLILANTVFIVIALFDLWPLAKKIVLFSLLLGFVFSNIEFIFLCLVGLQLDAVLDPQKVYPNFGNMRFFNQVQVHLVFIIAAILLVSPKAYYKLAMLLGAIGVFMLLLAGARGALISLVLVLLFTQFFSNLVLKQLATSFLKIFFWGAMLFGIYLIYEQYIQQNSIDYLMRAGSSGRLSMWSEVAAGILQNPLGVGPYHYGAFSANHTHSHPHNSVLQFALEWGVAAGIAILVLMLSLLLYIIQLFRRENNLFRLAVGCSLLAGLAYSLLSGVFVMPASQIVFVFLLAYLFSNNRLAEYKKNHSICVQSGNLLQINLVVKAACLSSIFIALVFYGFYGMESYRRYHLVYKSGPNVTQPLTTGARMWAYGGIVSRKQ